MEIQPPVSMCFTGNLSENWKRFKQRFELYLEATDSANKHNKQKTSLLLHVIGDEGVEIYNTFTYDNADDKWSLDIVKTKFENHFTPKKNITVERFHFNNCNQQEGEAVDHYVTRLRSLAANCEFENLKDSLIKDRLVCGIQDLAARERLLREDDLQLAKAIKICQSAELVKTQAAEIQGGSTDTSVHAVKSKFAQKTAPQKKKSYSNKNEPTEEKHDCRRCGYRHASMKCPAYGQICNKCGGKNHFQKCCKSQAKNSHVYAVAEDDEENPCQDVFFLDSVLVDSVAGDWIQAVTINGNVIPMKLDTGAQVNILSEADFKTLKNPPKLHKVKERLRAYGDNDIPVMGGCRLKITAKGNTHNQYFYIVNGSSQPILGRSSCENMNLVRRVDDNQIRTTSDTALLHEFRHVFEGLGELPGEHNIVLDENISPVVHPSRKIPFILHDQLKKQLDKMEELKVITKVSEPTDWVNSLVIAKKSNGQLRICLDPRDLNRAIKRQHYKMPTREEIMAKFSGAKYFSKLDASNGFWQLKLTDASSYLCTFNTPFGLYRYLRLPFGISSAPEVYHKTVHEMFEIIPNVFTSMDDIIVWGETKEEHDRSLHQVFEVAAKNNLKLNREKCQLGVNELIFLGDKLTAEGLKPDDSKVEAINNMPTPTCKQDVQRFLGMVTYLAKWIPGLSEKSTALRQLLEKDIPWQWNPEQDKTFQELKQVLTTRPVLQYYNPELPIRISSDASPNGIGAVILQCHGNNAT